MSPRALADIRTILAWSEETFGPNAVRRYEKLIQTPLGEFEKSPTPPGSLQRGDVAENCWTYHLIHCRKQASTRGKRVRHPRHFILYRLTESGDVAVGRVLHDSMDLNEQLPEEYRAPSE